MQTFEQAGFAQAEATLLLPPPCSPFYECTTIGVVSRGQMALRVPYAQQFSPEQTPLNKLLPILRTNKGKKAALKKAIAGVFFKGKADPEKLAGNTLISLGTFGILSDDNLTEFGNELVGLQDDIAAAHDLLAKQLLVKLDAKGVVDTLQEMGTAGIEINLQTLPTELKARGYEVSSNSSDLSGVLNWLRAAGVLQVYKVNASRLASLLGVQEGSLGALKSLNREQIAFLRAMVCLDVADWYTYDAILSYAKNLYPGEVRYNEKDIVKSILVPLKAAGFIDFRKQKKLDASTPEGRGGKPADVLPTNKFQKEFADPLLQSLFRASGYTEMREIRGKSLADIVAEVKQTGDPQKSGKALEWLAVRLCQLLDLEFMGLRETDVDIAGGGEVDAMMHAARLIYSRWQVQCKVGPVTLSAVAKEVGMCEVTLANVILIVSTKKATDSAITYRQKIISTSNLNIIFVDGPLLERVIKDNSTLLGILREQAEDALNLKKTSFIKSGPSSPSGSGGVEVEKAEKPKPKEVAPAYETPQGQLFNADSLDVLPALIEQGIRAKLILTSPPFPLVRKKEYGNEDSDSYVAWFEKFIPYFKRILEPGGSLVIDLGGVWIKGVPAKSTYQYKLLLKLCESGYYLAQEFYHYNPARLPTPAEWVTVRRMRVKDAINNVWWVMLDPFSPVTNRGILSPYSDAMKHLLKNGYKPALRPSGHDISDKFQRDNGGAIPPNLLTLANTDSSGYYLRRCKEESIKSHPARFPQGLADFFIKFLTRPGDLVIDPFAGSNVTGASAESLGRKWIGIELDSTYAKASRFRFEDRAAHVATDSNTVNKIIAAGDGVIA
jgi:DNA modification methylase